MKKKEIAQQFPRQMSEQKPSTLTQNQIISILTKIKNLYINSEMKTKHLMREISVQENTLTNLQRKRMEVNRNLEALKQMISGTAKIFQESQKVSLWQFYWMVFLMGILATLLPISFGYFE